VLPQEFFQRHLNDLAPRSPFFAAEPVQFAEEIYINRGTDMCFHGMNMLQRQRGVNVPLDPHEN
jgi:hypothetical protein